MTNLEEQIQDFAKQALEAHGLVLVSARLMGGARSLVLQVLAENPDGTSPSVDACAQTSRTLAAQLDVAEILNTRYILEVSSPGLDRPLTKGADYLRFVGKQAKLQLVSRLLLNESYTTSIVGIIKTASESSFTFQVADTNAEPVTLKYTDIKSAYLHPSTAELTLLMKQANMTYKEAPMGVDEQDFREERPAREEHEENDVRPARPAGRPDFKRGNVMLNEQERKELGIMSDDEKIAHKTKQTQERYENRGKDAKAGFAKKAWAERSGKVTPGGDGPKKVYSKFGANKAAAPAGRGKFSSKPSRPDGGRPGGAGGGFKKPSNRGR